MKEKLFFWYETVLRTLPRRVSAYAASASFFITLSVFPALLLLLCILQYLPVTVSDLTQFLDSWLPEAVTPLVDLAVEELYRSGSSMTLVSVSAVTAFWSAARGVLGVLGGLNEVLGIEDHRSYLARRLLSGTYTLALALAILIPLGLHAAGVRLRAAILLHAPLVIHIWDFLIGIRALVVVPVLTLVFAVIYKVLPDRKTRFRTQLPGALIAAMAWEIYSELFSMYLAGSSSFSYMYGSLVTIAVAMVWLYACMAILFYGAAVNRLISSRPG